jgi:ribosomal subunit interface protein
MDTDRVDTTPVDAFVAQTEIVVRGRNVVVPDHFRQHVREKLAKLERYDGKVHRTDVELQHERNPRQNGSCQHVEITCRTRGPVVRSEACAEDFYKALDIAVDRLERRFARAADRRRIHHGRRTPRSIAEQSSWLPDDLVQAADGNGAQPGASGAAESGAPESGAAEPAAAEDQGPGRIVREKEHLAHPMTVDQALFEMELVGHDFFLFRDSETNRASVVYRRHAYDYGLIRLA